MTPDWVALQRELAALAQNGRHYARLKDPVDDWDVERYERIREIAGAIVDAGAGHSPGSMARVLADEVGHATTKVDVRGVVVDDAERFLLVREASDGRGGLPGGWAEPGSSPSEAVAKEVREEAGRDVRVTRLVGCFDRDLITGAEPYPFRVYKLYFLCTDLGAIDRGGGTAAAETTDVGWFPHDDLPPLSIARTGPDHLRRVREVIRDPARGPEFD